MFRNIAKIILLLVIFALVAGISLASNNIAIFVNGTEIISDPPAQMINDRVMVPIKFVGDALGAKVDWVNNSVVISTDPNSSLPLLKLNGEQTTWPYWVEDGVLYLEYRDTLQLMRECHPHPYNVFQYYKSSSTFMFNGNNYEIPYKDEGGFRIISINYLKFQKLLNYNWDPTTGDMTIIPIQ